MNKQPALTAQTKQNLIDAFWELYGTKRIEKITIKEITTKAGYNRGTFYEYFVDVYDVLEQIENSLIAELQEVTPHDVPSDAAIPFELILNMYAEHSKYFSVLLGEHGNPAFVSKVKNSFKPVIKQKITELGVQDTFVLDYTLEYALSAMIGIIGYWFQQENKPPLKDLIGLIQELTDEGVMKTIQKA